MSTLPRRSWLRDLPKCELHLHLEGTIEPKTLVELSNRHDAVHLTLEDAEKLYHYDDFTGFLKAFGQVTRRLKDAQDFALITLNMIKALAKQGIRHAEVYISFNHIYRGHSTTIEEVMDAVEKARIQGEQEYGTTIYWIADAVRQFGLEESGVMFRKAVELRAIYPSIVGVGIGGNEERGPVKEFAKLFDETKKAGLRITAHAGEAVPAFSIWDALEVGAERIGHGLTAASDNDLLKVLKERQVPMELCVTSNVCTGGCPSAETHPIRRYYDDGLMVTINTDDPPMFRTTLLDEYELVQRQFNFSDGDMVKLARNSILSSFLPTERMNDLVKQLDTFAFNT